MKHGTLWPALLLMACGGVLPEPPAAPEDPPTLQAPVAEDAEALACAADPSALLLPDAATQAGSIFTTLDGVVSAVKVEATPSTLAAQARELLVLAPGSQLNARAVRADVERLWALGGLEDVQVQSSGPKTARTVTYVLLGAPKIRAVFYQGETPATVELKEALALGVGDRFDSGALGSGLTRSRDAFTEQGYRTATLHVTGRRVSPGEVDLCVRNEAGPQLLLQKLRVRGNQSVSQAEIDALITSKVGKPLNDLELEQGMLRLQSLYYDRGMLTSVVSPPELKREADGLSVVIRIEEGPVFKVGSIQLRGSLVTTKAAYLKRVTLKPGAIFNRSTLTSDLQRLATLHEEQGAKDVEIVPETKLDPKKKRVDVILVVGASKAALPKP